jgi:hypothetical protein
MSEAETILWFAMTALFGGAVCYLVRGLLGETVRVSKISRRGDGEPRRDRHRVTWPLIGLGLGMFALSIGSLVGALAVRRWFDFGVGSGIARLTMAVSAGLLLPAFVLIGLGVVGDRPKGRKRCPGCWYDMSAGGARCPECGRAIRGDTDLERSRRRKWPFVMATLFVLGAGYAWTHAGRISRAGWLGGVPTTALVIGWKWLPDSAVTDAGVDGSLAERISFEESVPLGLWSSTTRSLENPGSVAVLLRAAELREQMALVRSESGSGWDSEEFLLSREAGSRLGSFILEQRPATASDRDALRDLVWFVGGNARLTPQQLASILRRIADGEDVDEARIALLRTSLEFEDRPSGPGVHAPLVLDALEGQRFPIGDRRLAFVAVTVARLAEIDAGATDRLHDLTGHPSAPVRWGSFRALLHIWRSTWREGDDTLPPRLRDRLGVAVGDPDPAVRSLAATYLVHYAADDDASVRRIVEALRGTGPGREGLIPRSLGEPGVPWAFQAAVAAAIADNDPLVAARAAECLASRLYDFDASGVTLANRARALIDGGAMSDPSLEGPRAALEQAIGIALERAGKTP